MSGLDAVRRLAVHLQPAHAHAAAGGKHLELLARGDGPRHQRPRHHRPESLQHERAIDGQPHQPPRRPARRPRGQPPELVAQGVEPEAGPRRHTDHRRAVQERARHQLAGFDLRQRDAVRIRHVALGEHDGATRDPEQAADVEVLAGLRHHRLVGGHDQQHGVDAVRPGQHVAHEPLVAGHVDEGRDHARAEVGVREPEIDGDPALLLLLQAVGIGAGQRAHERALAVIDVAGGADDEGALQAAARR